MQPVLEFSPETEPLPEMLLKKRPKNLRANNILRDNIVKRNICHNPIYNLIVTIKKKLHPLRLECTGGKQGMTEDARKRSATLRQIQVGFQEAGELLRCFFAAACYPFHEDGVDYGTGYGGGVFKEGVVGADAAEDLAGMGVEGFQKDVGAVAFENDFQEIGVGEPIVQAEAEEVGALRYVFGMGALKFPGEGGCRIRKDVARGVNEAVERRAAHSGGLLDVGHRNAFEPLFFQACAEPEHYLLR